MVLAGVDVGDLEGQLFGATWVGVFDVQADLATVLDGLGARVFEHQLRRQIGVQVLIDLAHDAQLQHLFSERPKLFLERQEVAVVEAAGGLHQHRRAPARLDPRRPLHVGVRNGRGQQRRHEQHPPAFAQRSQRLGSRHRLVTLPALARACGPTTPRRRPSV